MYMTAMTVCLLPRWTGGAFLSSFQRRKNVSACFQEELRISLNNAAELRETRRAYYRVPRALFAILRIAQTYEITLRRSKCHFMLSYF